MTYDPHAMQRQFERTFPNLQKGDMFCDDYGYERLPRSTSRNIDPSECTLIGTTVFDFENKKEMFVRNVPSIEGLEYIGNHLLNDGIANFIQVGLKKNLFGKRYFRAGYKPHNLLLKDFLEETGINQKNYCNVLGGGIIGEAKIFGKRGYTNEQATGYFVAQSSNLVPEMTQIPYISSQINKPIEYLETYGRDIRTIKSANKDITIKLPRMQSNEDMWRRDFRGYF